MEGIYKASIIPAADIPPDEPDNASGEITITFDQTTGIIERAVSSKLAELSPLEQDPNLPQLFVSVEEFENLAKSVSKKTIFIADEYASSLTTKVLLGHKNKGKVALSKVVTEEYERQIPGVDEPFSCR